jgi:hypothetical protein
MPPVPTTIWADIQPMLNSIGVLIVAVLLYVQNRKGSTDGIVTKFLELQEGRLTKLTQDFSSVMTELQIKRDEVLTVRQEKHDQANEFHKKELTYELEIAKLKDCITHFKRILQIMRKKLSTAGIETPELEFEFADIEETTP